MKASKRTNRAEVAKTASRRGAAERLLRDVKPRSGDIYVAQRVSAGTDDPADSEVSRGAATFLFGDHLNGSNIRRSGQLVGVAYGRRISDVAAPRLQTVHEQHVPSAHALGYIDAAAPRLENGPSVHHA